ncbi:MAG: 16S rRNA (cytosine(1402)-N(4))-methyltransferase RsmH [Chitinophagaceae bacterium]|nr:16S rRNA (cytosine(1402)-N(4))-methyltransferase RsmH [Chitinophagaceae bacterium]HMN31744.1 16S rRNA (cytosine(1402)-N(4))-methyltransferase RsmH [Chitinophagaceae bacterium]
MKDESTFYHQPVLLNECIEQLNIKPDGVYLDATYGGGGHSKEILKRLNEHGTLIVFDQDDDAKRNIPDDKRILFVPENFRYASRFVRLYKLPSLDGVLADLGVSSYQFDTPDRGFSTRFDALLDMRMDQRNPLSAMNVLNEYKEPQLKQIFEQYGEVTNAKNVARSIAEARMAKRLTTINELKQTLAKCIYGNENKYFAQIFQAIRIEVNDELNALMEFLETITLSMSENARICMITFHSLEDRIVKQWMKNETFQNEPDFFTKQTKKKNLKIITKRPILPSEEEIKNNSRARSAKLRVAQKV